MYVVTFNSPFLNFCHCTLQSSPSLKNTPTHNNMCDGRCDVIKECYDLLHASNFPDSLLDVINPCEQLFKFPSTFPTSQVENTNNNN